MKKNRFFIVGSSALWAAALIFAGCTITSDSDNGRTKGSAITLTENDWTDGTITSTNKEQWFKFTATAGMHYLHVSFGTLTDMYVQVYDSKSNPVGDETNFGGSGSGSGYTPLTLTKDKTYYIRVTPRFDGSGTYQVAFNTTQSPPLPASAFTAAETLVEDEWTNGNITSSKNEQRFKFTATAAMQYIHVNFGTLLSLYIQLYDSDGKTRETEKELHSTVWNSKTSASFKVTSGQEYYLRVTRSSGSSGTYQIAFNKSDTAPQ
jgi:hypothetical protein